ncbi:MAG: FAD-binding oxidoreductase [Candidatus Bathyarchaeota archaeon]
MSSNVFIDKLIEIVGKNNVTCEKSFLENYSKDISFVPPMSPQCVVWPMNREEIVKIVNTAVKHNVPLVPVSSGSPRLRGDTIPEVEGTVVVHLSRMNRILRIDRKNRVVMVEPGVTFNVLVKEMYKHGLRLLAPLSPRSSKSVLASCLEREPVTIPKYHWDAADPLLCTEVVFGTGDVFRTGAAAGPGGLEEQWASGQAQKNPLGPTQFDPFRLLQGAQGTMGIVTWATVKCELLPEIRRLFFVPSDNLEELLDFTYIILRRRLGDELFILNRMNMAALLCKSQANIEKLRKKLPEWILIICLSGRGRLAKDEIEYLEGDVSDIAYKTGVKLVSEVGGILDKEFLVVLEVGCEDPYWKLRFKGGGQEIFFLTTLNKTPDFFKAFVEVAKEERYPEEDIGVYIQPLVQGCYCHCEFDLYYGLTNQAEISKVYYLYMRGGEVLLKKGGFFSRPYGPFAKLVYKYCPSETVEALRKVKRIFDPENLMNPGKLCF